jgi:hypothetical protein
MPSRHVGQYLGMVMDGKRSLQQHCPSERHGSFLDEETTHQYANTVKSSENVASWKSTQPSLILVVDEIMNDFGYASPRICS